MRRAIQIGLLAALVIVCLLNVAVVRYIYIRYEQDSEKLREVGYRIEAIEAKTDLNNRWETRTITQEIVSTSGDSTNSGGFILHLDMRTNTTQRFELQVGKEVGRPVGAWVSEWNPHAEMLKFEVFHVAPDSQSGKIELLVTPRTNENINMRFTITVLEQKFVR
jgi:hypothetical protein